MLRAGLLVLAIASAAGSASASPLFEDFQTICLKSDVEPKAAIATAEAAGWMPIPDALMSQLSSAMKGAEDIQGRLHSDAGGLRFVIVARTGPDLPPDALMRGIDHANICAVGGAPPESSFPAQFASWAGVAEEPSLTKGPTHGYAFVVDGAAHRKVDPKGPEMAGLVKAGSVRLAFLETDAQVTMAGIAAPLKESH
jgi:hypothetical protein